MTHGGKDQNWKPSAMLSETEENTGTDRLQKSGLRRVRYRRVDSIRKKGRLSIFILLSRCSYVSLDISEFTTFPLFRLGMTMLPKNYTSYHPHYILYLLSPALHPIPPVTCITSYTSYHLHYILHLLSPALHPIAHLTYQ
jgi:hypothetical protein